MKRPFIRAAVRAELDLARREGRPPDFKVLRRETGAHWAKLLSLAKDILESGTAVEPPNPYGGPEGGVAAGNGTAPPESSGTVIAAASPDLMRRV